MPRAARLLAPAVLLASALGFLFLALEIGGAAKASVLIDPGELVRYGLPVVRMLVDLTAGATIGALVLACFAMSPAGPEWNRTLDLAAATAAVWTVASATTAIFTFLDLSAIDFSAETQFGQLLWAFLTERALGQAWLYTTIVPAVLTVLCFAVRGHTLILFVTVFAASGLVPLALQGHAAGTADHEMAVSSLGLHLVFASVWLGGLVAMVYLQPVVDRARLTVVLRRYSSLALLSFVITGVSGVASAALRIGAWEALATPYGILVLGKVAALVALGVVGAGQRTFAIGRLERGRSQGWYWWIVVAELAVMGIAFGLAAGLGRTRTPVPQLPITDTPSYILTGEPHPPELTPLRYITEWRFDLLWIVIAGAAIFFYLAGVRRLQRRGDSWPIWRTLSWVAGMLLLFYITNGGVNLYERYLFSAHMLAHMVLGMGVPLLLVPGAPVTLAARSIARRDDGSRGPREWILLAVHSRYAGILARPVVAAALFAGSLWVFYYTPLFRWAVTDHIGHTAMIVHFLASGYLFVQTLVGIDPMPYRAPHPIRLVVLLGTMAFHAFFGLTLMTGTSLLVADWFGALGRDWGGTALADQQIGGGVAWSIGEIPTVILAIAVVISWSRSDDREAKRLDRKADRDHDADLEAYNAMLADLEEKTPRH